MHITRRITCLCIGLLLCLTACRTGNSAPQQQEPVSTLPQAAYTPRPMPPPEGLSAMEGHMLWPVQRITGMSSYDGEKFRNAFINAAGEIVTSSDIIRFHYQRDENDRIAYLIASDEQRVYVYTLDGTKILDSPGENADVFPDEGLALITLRTADNYGEWNTENRMTVFSLSSGEPLLTGDYVHISQISGYTVLLIDTQLRQFACDLRQGENARVPLVGFLTSRTITNEPADWRLAAMTSPERYEEGDNLYGFVGPEGPLSRYISMPAPSPGITPPSSCRIAAGPLSTAAGGRQRNTTLCCAPSMPRLLPTAFFTKPPIRTPLI